MDKSVLGADSTVCYTRTDLGDIAALHEMKAQALMEVEEYFAAVEAAEAAVAAAPLWVPAWETLGRARLNFGEVDLAVVALERVRVCVCVCVCACVCVCVFVCVWSVSVSVSVAVSVAVGHRTVAVAVAELGLGPGLRSDCTRPSVSPTTQCTAAHALGVS